MTSSIIVTDDLSVTSGRALREVFSKQLKLQILESPDEDSLSTFEGKLLHSAVSINGEKISGTVLLQLPEALAHQITEIMLGSAGDAEEIRDVTGGNLQYDCRQGESRTSCLGVSRNTRHPDCLRRAAHRTPEAG